MTHDPFNIEGRVVVITGGLGQLGRQFSQAILGRGAKVAVFDVRGSQQAASLHEYYPADHYKVLTVDITSRASVKTGLREVTAQWGTPHGLVNNAAVDSPPHSPAEENGPFENYPEASWDRVMEVNAKGTFLCCQVVGKEMADAGRGSIINISSIYGMVSPDQRIYDYRRRGNETFFKPVAYSASKAAVLNLTRYLATYWARNNVRVNTLTFGGVFNNQDDQFLAGYCTRVPMWRMAREDEYNGAVIFLVSDASSYMTGANLVLDGGWTAW